MGKNGRDYIRCKNARQLIARGGRKATPSKTGKLTEKKALRRVTGGS